MNAKRICWVKEGERERTFQGQGCPSTLLDSHRMQREIHLAIHPLENFAEECKKYFSLRTISVWRFFFFYRIIKRGPLGWAQAGSSHRAGPPSSVLGDEALWSVLCAASPVHMRSPREKKEEQGNGKGSLWKQRRNSKDNSLSDLAH